MEWEPPDLDELEDVMPLPEDTSVDLIETLPKAVPLKRKRLGVLSGPGGGTRPPITDTGPPAPPTLPPQPGQVPPPVLPPPVDGPYDEDAPTDLVPAPEEAPEREPKTARRDLGERWTQTVRGLWVMYDGDWVVNGQPDPNWQIKCPHAAHHGKTPCKKRRGDTEGHRAIHGDIGPVAFLIAWVDVPPLEGKTHARAHPSPEQVAAVVEAHRDALEELVAQVKG